MKVIKKFKTLIALSLILAMSLSFIMVDKVYGAIDASFNSTIRIGSTDVNAGFRVTKVSQNGIPGEVTLVSVPSGTNSLSGDLYIPEEVQYLGNTYNVTAIGTSVFQSCSNLTSTGLENNNSVVDIGKSAFSNCTNLLNTGLGDNSSVITIGDKAFYYCIAITSTGLEKNTSVETVGSSAFYSCNTLAGEGLGRNTSVVYLADGAFVQCSNMTTFIFEGKNIPIIEHKDPFIGDTSTTIYYRSDINTSEKTKLSYILSGSVAAIKSYDIECEVTSYTGNYHTEDIYEPNDMEVDVTYTVTQDGSSLKTYTISYIGNKNMFSIPDDHELTDGTNTINGEYDGFAMSYDVVAHNVVLSSWIIDTDATTTTTGSKYKKCTVCDVIMEVEEIPVLEPPTTEETITEEPTTETPTTQTLTTEAPSTTEGTVTTEKPSVPDAPKTGDNSKVMLYIMILVMSSVVIYKLRIRNKEQK